MDKDSEKMLLEVLVMARELVINEHMDRRAQEHNAWLYEAELLWKTRRIKLQYPVIPPYPTEEDVVKRAHTLLKFLVMGNSKNDEPSKVVLPVQPIVEEYKRPIYKPKSKPKPKPEPVLEVIPETKPEPVLEVISETVLEVISEPELEVIPETKPEPVLEEEKSSSRLLPSVLKKIEKMRNRF